MQERLLILEILIAVMLLLVGRLGTHGQFTRELRYADVINGVEIN